MPDASNNSIAREIIPAILVQDKATFRERFALVESHVRTVHLDIMDGAFVPNRTWFDPEVLASLATSVRFECHLMVQDPALYLAQLHDLKNVCRCIWHIEIPHLHDTLIKNCHEYNHEAGLAINPNTALTELDPYIDLVDEILIMGAQPGFSGKTMEPNMVQRAHELRTQHPDLCLGFDIDVNYQTIPQLQQAGVQRFCCGSAIFNHEDPVGEIKKLNVILSQSAEGRGRV